MKLQDIKVSTQLRLGLGLILVFVLFLGALAWKQSDLLWLQTKEMYNHPLTVRKALGEFQAAVLIIHRDIRGVFLAETDQEIATHLQNIDKAKADAFTQLNILRDRYLGPPGDITTLHDEFVQWNAIRNETIRLLRAGKIKEAAARTKAGGVGCNQAKLLMDHIRKIGNFAANRANRFYLEAQEVKDTLNRRLAILAAVILSLSFCISYFLLRGVKEPLRQLTTAADHFGQGKLDVRCPYVSANEFGVLSQAFNTMADRLQSQFWLKDGLAALNHEVGGDRDADQIGAGGLNFISRYVGACAGGFYAYDPAEARWELKAPYAQGEGTYLAPRFKAGEGIVGQVAADKKPIFLSGITREAAVAHSSTVSEPPRSLYAVPLLYQGELSGVMEVASFAGIDAGQREFLDAAAHILAVSLYAAVQKDRIRELLKVAQEANEELAVMNEELQAQSEEMQAQTEELQAQTQELERQRLQVEEADRLKSEFLANMSHELRTPLNSVLALTQLMIARGTGKDAAQETEYLQVIDRNGRHLLHLINDILDIARIESGRVQLTLTSIDPGETCARALGTVRPLAVERSLELKAGCGDLPRMFTDEDKLQQILINLLSNAIKFTERGEIKLEAAAAADQVRFTVRDTGVGIAPEVLPSIFDKFRQADGSFTRRFEGTGLGLAICRSLANILGGEISVESRVDRGSAFTLTLPITCPEPQEAADATPIIGSFPEPAPFQPQPAPSKSRRQPPLILVVEDNPVAVLHIRTVLEGQGYAVQAFPSGAEALAALPQARPDLIVLDLMLPEVDGFQVLEQLRAIPATATIPVLVLTARELTPKDRARLAQHHVRQFVQKGNMNREELAACVQGLLGEAAASVSPPPAPAPQPRISRPPDGPILVVEDNRDNLLVITAILEEAGYKYLTATDGLKAVALARETPPALILMDMQLPGAGGLEAARQIKADLNLRATPIAALTAMAMRGDREEILAAGLDDYLAKPFEPQELLKLVRRWLG
ncbi:MAG TPA: response regulator [Desulfobaccales bacterium]|nr:response regulator [Desulfobaccales bacterium]